MDCVFNFLYHVTGYCNMSYMIKYLDIYLGAGQGRQRGEQTNTGNGGRRRHAEQGAGKSGGGCWVSGAGDVQVGGALHWERR